MANRQQIQALADRLISTLDSSMDSDRADAIVRDAAEELYNGVLGVKGRVVVDRDQPTSIVHGGFGPNGKRASMTMAKYKFQEEA